MKALTTPLLLLAVVPSMALAQTVQFKGRELVTSAPSGFCELGGNDSQDAMLEFFKGETGGNLKLIAMAVPCEAIPALSRGEEVIIPRWLITNITTPLGKEFLLPYDRAEYMRRMSANVPDLRLDEAAMIAKFSVPPKKSDRAEKLLLGANRDAFFFEMNKQAASPEGPIWLRIVSAQTVINGVPLSQLAYERIDVQGENTWISLNALLNVLLSNNERK